MPLQILPNASSYMIFIAALLSYLSVSYMKMCPIKRILTALIVSFAIRTVLSRPDCSVLF